MNENHTDDDEALLEPEADDQRRHRTVRIRPRFVAVAMALAVSLRAMENSHTTRRVIVKSEEGRMQITGRVGIHRVADFGPFQGDDGDAVDAFGGDARVHAAITHEPVATGYGEQP